jgi:hypothetical protein
MPRGGRRVGTGRKPTAKRGVVLGLDGARRPDPGPAPPPIAVNDAAPAAVDAIHDMATPPADLPVAQQDFWRIYAPAAIEQRTLITATVGGFRELCEQFALKQAIATRIGKLKLGAASKSAEGPLRHYVKLSQRVDASMARFKLTAMGKPAEVGVVKPATANPWAAVAGR